MLIISPILYEQYAEMLVEALKSRTFYSGSLRVETPEIDYRLEVTLLIYYGVEDCPHACERTIERITSIWWEFHTEDDDGEIPNDFDFNLLTRLICR